MSEIREYRSRETLGDAYRKPYAYKQLIENNVQEPFIRKDARRKRNCYTQLTDVQQEINGLMDSERNYKIDSNIIRNVNNGAY